MYLPNEDYYLNLASEKPLKKLKYQGTTETTTVLNVGHYEKASFKSSAGLVVI